MDKLIIDTNVLITLGKLALFQALTANARMELMNFSELLARSRIELDDDALMVLKRAASALEDSEYSISDALYDVADSIFKSQHKD